MNNVRKWHAVARLQHVEHAVAYHQPVKQQNNTLNGGPQTHALYTRLVPSRILPHILFKMAFLVYRCMYINLGKISLAPLVQGLFSMK